MKKSINYIFSTALLAALLSGCSPEPLIVSYTITFETFDAAGEVVKTLLTFDEGTLPVYSGETPTKAETEGYTYTFAGWLDEEENLYSGDLPAVTKDTTYTASFTETPKTFVVTFYNETGTSVLKEGEYEYGDLPIAPRNQTKESIPGKYDYTFAGWKTSLDGKTIYKSNALPEVTSNAEYYAAFEEKGVEYTLTIKCFDKNSSLLDTKTEKIYYGSRYYIPVPVIEGMTSVEMDYIQGSCSGNVSVEITYLNCDKYVEGTTLASESLSGEGTESSPYLISSVADWLYLHENSKPEVPEDKKHFYEPPTGTYVPTNHYKLTKSLDLSGLGIEAKIGGLYGSLDGDNNKIIIHYEEANEMTGLFSLIAKGASVTNLTMSGSITSTASYNGSLVSKCEGTVKNCVNLANVSSSANGVGGLIGAVRNGTIENCKNYGTCIGIVPQATSKVGGIAGLMEKTTIDNVVYSGTIFNCVNYGEVRGFNAIGGITGEIQPGVNPKLEENINYGFVHANEETTTVEAKLTRAGGIVGLCSNNIKNNINYGEVFMDGTNTQCWIGGVAGAMTGNPTVQNCVNHGYIHSLTATESIGGVGGASGTNANVVMDNCSNDGEVYAPNTKFVGGICGGTLQGSASFVVKNSTNSGKITGKTNVAGIVGLVYAKFVTEETRPFFYETNTNTGEIIGENTGNLIVEG